MLTPVNNVVRQVRLQMVLCYSTSTSGKIASTKHLSLFQSPRCHRSIAEDSLKLATVVFKVFEVIT